MDDRLSPIESIMWRVGQDASLRMVVGAVAVLDRPPSVDDLVGRLAEVVDAVPRLRHRPDDPTYTRARPAWTAELGADAGSHLRHLAVAAPGSMRDVLDLVSLVESVPFDPDRSPWDVTLMSGLEGDRAALYLRAHHVLTDGIGGIRLLGHLLDEPGWPGTVDGQAAPAPEREPEPRPVRPREPGVVTMTMSVDVGNAVRRVAAGVNAARDVDLVDSTVRGLQRALDVANSVSRQILVTGGPMAALPPHRSVFSRFEVFSVDGARRAALGLGGSRNDLVVAAVAAGLGRYHEKLGAPSPELRLVTPTVQRRGPESGGNWFAPTRVEVPTGVGRPSAQFGVVVERLAQARREPALRVTRTLASTIGRLPTRLLLPALRAQADSVDFAATTLPGLRDARHIGGSALEAVYPLGPRLGCPMNVTAFGNGDRLDVGIAVDPAAFPEPDHLVDCVTEAFQALLGGQHVGDRAGRGARQSRSVTAQKPG